MKQFQMIVIPPGRHRQPREVQAAQEAMAVQEAQGSMMVQAAQDPREALAVQGAIRVVPVQEARMVQWVLETQIFWEDFLLSSDTIMASWLSSGAKADSLLTSGARVDL